jgi:hypothetical protein
VVSSLLHHHPFLKILWSFMMNDHEAKANEYEEKHFNASNNMSSSCCKKFHGQCHKKSWQKLDENKE